jgi:hypothetical protein
MRKVLALAACVVLSALWYSLPASGVQSVVYTVTTGSTTLETIACNGGVSPCTIGTTSTTVLNANPARADCLIQNVNTTDFYCIKGTGTASTTNMQFILAAATAANKAGGSYSCNQGPVVWRGAVVCAGSAASGTLNASGTLAAGF